MTNIKKILTNDEAYVCGYSPDTAILQAKAKKLCWEYNQTSPEEKDKRNKILHELFGTCSDQTWVEPSFHCDYGFNIHTSGMTLINYNCVILDTSPVHIGKSVFIAPGVCIACSGHAKDPAQRAEGISTSAPVTIGDRVWIGANAVICGGVTIGNGSIIGAGSVVNHDIPEGVLAAGVPCKVIRKLTDKDKIQIQDLKF